MFSSVNFLFLISLAFLSWIILCYLKQIEEQRAEEINSTNFIMERTFDDSPVTPCRDNYNIFLNFLCIFTCIYALGRITHMTENYIAKTMHKKIKGPMKAAQNETNSDVNMNEKSDEPCFSQKIALVPSELVSPTLDDMIARQKEFLSQIKILKRQNEQLEQQLLQVKRLQSSTNYVVVCKKDEDMVGEMAHMENNSIVQNKNNIFISNSHVHMNRQVYVNEGNIKLDLKDFQQTDRGDFSQIWQKYLEMQKFAIRAHPRGGELTGSDDLTPIVVSTEQLQTIQGLF